MGGAHDHGHDQASEPVNRLLLLAVAPFLLATLVGVVLLWPGPVERNEVFGGPVALYDGTVSDVAVKPCLGAEDGPARCLTMTVRMSEGPEKGQRIDVEIGEGPGSPEVDDGDPVVLGRSADPGGQVTYYFADFQRRTPLLLLALLFAVVVVLLGRWRGLAALAALAVSLLVVVRFVLPAVLEGSSPLAVAVVGAAVIMFLALYLTHGVNAQTTTAVLGTMVSLALTAVLGSIFVGASRFTGLGSEEAGFLQSAAGQVNLQGLLLGGIVIGSLGVLDDVTVTQASAVWQLHRANPALTVRELYRSGLHIGRDHIASTVNTLVLAYAGASLPLLLLFSLAQQPAGVVITGETVAVEVVRTLVGSVGLVASVPITTALAALVVSRQGAAPGAAPAGAAPATTPAPIAASVVPPPPKKWKPPAAEREFWTDEPE